MGQKRTAEELNRTADNNGYVTEAYEEEDQIEWTRDEPKKRYIQNQNESLDLWRAWVLWRLFMYLIMYSITCYSNRLSTASCQEKACLLRSAYIQDVPYLPTW